MRTSLCLSLFAILCLSAFSSCNTLANRRSLFSPGKPEGPYWDELAEPRSDDAYSEVFRMRYQRKISTPSDSGEGTYGTSSSYDEPYAPSAPYEPNYSDYESTSDYGTPSSEETYERLFRKRY